MPHAIKSVVPSTVPVLLAVVVSTAVLVAAGHDPLEFYRLLLRESFGGSTRVAATLASATPLLFSGVATAIAFRAGVFNIGVEGSFIAGAFATAAVGVSVDLPAVVLLPLVFVAAAAAGTLVAAGPAYLKAYREVDEVVVTLMGNFIVVGIAAWLLQEFFLSGGTGNASTELVNDGARLPVLVDGTQLTYALPVAIVVLVATFYWLRHHVAGYEVRMIGANLRFARAQGIAVPRTIMIATLASGAIGGIGGWGLTSGVLHRYIDGAGRNLGFTGIAVALLGRGHPVGVVLAAVLLGALSAAGPTIQLFSSIPLDIVRVMQGTIMMAAVLEFFRVRDP